MRSTRGIDLNRMRISSLMAVAAGVCVALASRGATATTTTTTYFGNECAVVDPGAFAYAYDPGDAGLEAFLEGTTYETTGIDIVCPIVKSTSAPGNPHADAITDVEISVSNDGNAPGIECQVSVYTSAIPSSGSNWKAGAGPTTSAFTATNISFSSGVAISNWWGTDSWYYAQLECHINVSQELEGYTVTEQGSDSAGYATWPAGTFCWSDVEMNTSTGEYRNALTDNSHGQTGFIESAPYYNGLAGDVQFAYDCEMPGTSVQFSMLPSTVASEGWGWSFNYDGVGSPASWTCPGAMESGSGQSTNFPSLNFPGSTTNVPSANRVTVGSDTFIKTSSEYWIYFSSCTDDGDMALVSARSGGD